MQATPKPRRASTPLPADSRAKRSELRSYFVLKSLNSKNGFFESVFSPLIKIYIDIYIKSTCKSITKAVVVQNPREDGIWYFPAEEYG